MTVLMPATGRVSHALVRRDPPNPFESRADEFDLTAGLRLIRRRFVMITVISALLTMAAVPAILHVKPLYHAASRLMIHSPLASALDTTQPGQGSTLNITSETERLLSRRIAERVIGELRLAELAESILRCEKPPCWARPARCCAP